MTGAVEDKVIAVTGAGGGIGREIALALGAAGAKVVVNDLPGPNAPAVVSQIEAAGGTAIASPDSIATQEGGEGLIARAIEAFGRIDGVVNNAGNVRDGIFHKMSAEDWLAVQAVHLNGSFYTSSAAAPHFREQGAGAFVHMTSTSGLIGNFGQANYAAAKMGIVGLSRSIALDMERFGVRSNCVAPFAWGAMTASIPTDTPEAAARVEKLKKMEAHKIAPLVTYLLSDLAQGVSGQIFGVRANEIMIFSQPRPVRSVHHAEGWSPETIAQIAIPAMKGNLTPLERSPQVIDWDPI
ncbi:MAG: SDR family oxidoreductase [Neomegalonema sp.]|nr:SDR family oxidoreductase [Neomegalonema sp.]